MTVARTVAEILQDRVTLEVECIDRLYMNLYIPILQRPEGCAHFWIHHRGHRFATSALMAPMSKGFVSRIENFSLEEGLDLVTFTKGQRKEDLAKDYLARFPIEDGVLFIGKAQEKAPTIRTRRRRNPRTGKSYPDLYKTTALVNQYYFYCVDRDFGPFFLKLSSYFPYNGKVCVNGHEYVKRQLERRGIGYEALDNGILSCEDPEALQRICDGLTEHKIERLARKWLRRLDPPSRVLAHPGARPPRHRQGVLRGDHPRQPRPRPARSRAARLRTTHHAPNPRKIPDPCHHARGHPFALRRLQVHAHQAVPQARSRVADGDHDQRYARLRDRKAAA
jgi:hypothetical protein